MPPTPPRPAAAGAPDSAPAGTPADRPLARAAALALGALAVDLLVDGGRVGFGSVPLLVGLAYLAAAAAGGRTGALWAPALVVTGWGVGNEARGWSLWADLGVTLPESAAHLAGAGLGVLALCALAPLGVVVSTAGVGLALLLSGVLFVGQRGAGWELLNRADGYALLLLAYAAAEVLTSVVRRVRPSRGAVAA